jgi:hypothetical protein
MPMEHECHKFNILYYTFYFSTRLSVPNVQVALNFLGDPVV